MGDEKKKSKPTTSKTMRFSDSDTSPLTETVEVQGKMVTKVPKMEPDEFFEMLVKNMNVNPLACGESMSRAVKQLQTGKILLPLMDKPQGVLDMIILMKLVEQSIGRAIIPVPSPVVKEAQDGERILKSIDHLLAPMNRDDDSEEPMTDEQFKQLVTAMRMQAAGQEGEA